MLYTKGLNMKQNDLSWKITRDLLLPNDVHPSLITSIDYILKAVLKNQRRLEPVRKWPKIFLKSLWANARIKLLTYPKQAFGPN